MSRFAGGVQGIPRAPTHWRGCRVGLLGGSYDPPHAGHLHLARQALCRLRLDRVWLMVSPGNPLKGVPHRSFSLRFAATSDIVTDQPRIVATDLEAQLGTVRTVDTLRRLRRRFPAVRFVWLMGSDNLTMMHRWYDWGTIFALVPVVAFARPGSMVTAGHSLAAQRFARSRVSEQDAVGLAHAHPPRWSLLGGPTSDDSSTRVRAVESR